MAQRSVTAYGYGRAFREYPQAQLQQSLAPLVQVGPDPVRYIPPWEVEDTNWAAEGAAQPIVLLTKANREREIPVRFPFPDVTVPLFAAQEAVYAVTRSSTQVKDPPAAFPFLGQWQPHQYDGPRRDGILEQFKLPTVIPSPPIIEPWQMLGLWTPTRVPLDQAYYSFRIPLAPVTAGAAGPDAWLTAFINTAALFTTQQIISMVIPSTTRTPFVPVPFPSLGQWQPATTPLDRAYYSFRIPLAAIGAGPAGPEAWLAELRTWTALNITQSVVLLVTPLVSSVRGDAVTFPPLGQYWPHQFDPPVRTAIFEQFKIPTAPITSPAIRFPFLGQWTPTTIPLDESFYSFRLRLMPVGAPAVGPEAWAAELSNWPSINAMLNEIFAVTFAQTSAAGPAIAFPKLGQWQPHLYDVPNVEGGIRALLDKLLHLPIGLPAVPFPFLGQWIPTAKPLDLSYYSFRIPLIAPPPPPPPLPIKQPWDNPLTYLPAIGHSELAVLLVRREAVSQSFVDTTGTWEAEQRNWAALSAAMQVRYIVQQLTNQIVIETPPTPSWAAEAANWSVLSYVTPATYLVRPERLQKSVVDTVPSWLAELLSWSSLNAAAQVRYAVQQSAGQVVPEALPIPAWATEILNWPTISYTGQAVYLETRERQPDERPLGLSTWERVWKLWAALGAADQVRYLVAPLAGQVRPEALPLPPWVTETANQAALNYVLSVLYLARTERQPEERPLSPSAWERELRANWVALLRIPPMPTFVRLPILPKPFVPPILCFYTPSRSLTPSPNATSVLVITSYAPPTAVPAGYAPSVVNPTAYAPPGRAITGYTPAAIGLTPGAPAGITLQGYTPTAMAPSPYGASVLTMTPYSSSARSLSFWTGTSIVVSPEISITTSCV